VSMTELGEFDGGYPSRRREVQRVACHVLARARHQAVGRFGLVPGPGGIATPAFGEEAVVVRLAPGALVVDRGGDSTHTPLVGATLRHLARAAGADIDAAFEAGGDTPEVGDPDAVIDLDATTIAAVGRWFELGWRALDRATTALGPDAAPTRIQLWPEHFDAGTSVAYGPGPTDRLNLGASPGDASHELPYLYVGPWSDERPGEPAYWNASFGAVLGYDDVLAADDPVDRAASFLVEGVERFRGERTVPSPP